MSVTITSLAQWKDWAAQYSRLPFVRKYKLEGALQISSWRKAWEKASDYAFVLESGKVGRYSFLGLHPEDVIRGKRTTAHTLEGRQMEGAPLSVLKEWMSPYHSPVIEDAPKFVGGCVGYLSYDIVRSLEKIPMQADDDLNLPDYVFMRMDELWILDHQLNELWCAVHMPWSRQEVGISSAWEQELEAVYNTAIQRTNQMKQLWDNLMSEQNSTDRAKTDWRRSLWERDQEQGMPSVGVLPEMETPFDREDFEQAVRQIQQYIGQGDVFQVNLSLRQSYELASSSEQLYEWLRLVNPSPYMGMLRFPDFQIVSASPELLVKLEQGRVSTRPIAGTRRRGRTPEEDAAMEQELRSNEKECAEHIMLVDLERNDLGRISRYGSVHVRELMVVERYSHVMHLVSEVEGELAAGKDAYAVLAATFPGGTITGAPKVRTMEIIEELEPVRRGPYTGSFGWIDYNGNMEFNIIIRTLTMMGTKGHIQTGAGIVIDSVPEREYAECLNKAKAMCKAIQLSEQEAAATARE